MFTVGVTYHFDSAHLIRGHEGKCRNLHGHRWVVEVAISGKELDETGMLADFGIIKRILKEKLDGLDHRNLIEIHPFDQINPTAENISREIFRYMREEIDPRLCLKSVTVRESPDCWAKYEE